MLGLIKSYRIYIRHLKSFLMAKRRIRRMLHTDLWVNTIGPKSKKVLETYLLWKDLIFLVCSMQYFDHKREMDNIIKHYFKVYSDVLKKYNCYGPQIFYDKFLKEFTENIDQLIGKYTYMLPIAVFNKIGNTFDGKITTI